MVFRNLQPSFTGGEISPSLRARVDAAGYHTWLYSAQNMFVHPQGGISNRPGTRYVANAKTANGPCLVLAFPITQDEAYILELGEHYLRVFTPSGPVLNAQGNPLEFTTPYSGESLARLQTAQYNQQLYFAHVDYPLLCFTRMAAGAFTLAEVALRYGPFMPANTDETKKLRCYPQTATVESEGVPASLSFAPVDYGGNLMVWAYFNGSCFYVSETYGLNVSAIAGNFNTAYNAQGLTAYNQGGVLTITSSAADGGNWNGSTFVLEYRSRFNGAADYTATQTLSGGENAGTQTVAQEGRYVLESNTAQFTPRHVGGKFCLAHTVPAQYQSGSLGYESVSPAILSGSDWSLRTSGTWTGTLTVEVSRDGGNTWQAHKQLSRASGEDNFYLTSHLHEDENLCCVRIRSGENTGEADYELSADSFIQRGVVNVLGYISSTQLVVAQERGCGSEDWTSYWAEGAFSPAAGYPACVFFYQDRLGLAATRREAQTLWFSKTGDPTDFGRARDTLLATDALTVRLGGTHLNSIQAVVVSHALQIFTMGSEWTLTCSGALSLDSVEIVEQSSRGSYPTAPVRVGNRTVFVQGRGSVVRELVYDERTASYTGDDLTLRAKHLLEHRAVTQLVYTQEPDTLVWCLLDDGALLSMTYVPEQHICAWTHHQTAGTVLSVCVLAYQGQDQLWMTVARAGGIFVERMTQRLPPEDPAGGVFLDASISTVRLQASTQVAGLLHLEGQIVCALADGNVVRNLTVQNGQITLPYAAKQVHVGLAYEARLRTLPLAALRAQNRKQRYVSAQVDVLNSRGGWVGTDENTLTELVQRTHEAYNQPVALQTDSYTVQLAARHEVSPGILIKQTDPLPLTILAIGVQAV